MSDHGLRFTEVRVDRMPGIGPGQGFTIEDLAPDVTLVVGPNGEGKTLSGRAIMELLWPGRTGLEHPTVSGAWTLDGHRWTVDVDAGHPSWRRDGTAAEPPSLPSADARPHHWIGLRDLLVDGGPDDQRPDAFAERIAREMLGGFDVPAAAGDLGFEERPGRPRKLVAAVESAQEELRAAEAAAARQHEEAAHLDELWRQRERAVDADRRMRRLDGAIALREANDRLAAVDAALADDDERLGRLQGNELELIIDARGRREAAADASSSAAARLRDATAAADATGLPAGGVPDAVAGDLAAAVDALGEAERRRREIEVHLKGAEEERTARRNAIGPAADEATLRGLGNDPSPELDRLARRGSSLRATEARVEEEGRRLASVRERLDREIEAARQRSDLTESPRLDELRAGRTTLVRWLVAPAAPAGAGAGQSWSIPWLIAAAIFAVAGALLSAFVHLVALIAVAAAVVLLVVARPGGVRSPRVATTEDAGEAGDRATREADYRRLGLPGPEDWSAPAVEAQVDRLVEMTAIWSELLEADRRMADREQAQRDAEASLAADAARLAEDHEAMEATLGIPLDVGADDWLHVLGGAVAGWRDADARVSRFEAERRTVLAEAADAAARCAACSAPYRAALGDVADDLNADEARRHRDELTRRSGARRSADDAAAQAQRESEQAAQACAEAEAEIARRFADAGVDLDDDETLRRLLGALPEHRERRQQRRDVAGRRDELQQELGDEHPAPDADLATLRSQHEEARQQAEGRSQIDLRIGGIEQSILAAGQGHDVETAMSGLAAARETLQEHLEASEAAVAGSAIADWLREEDEERTRPRVLRRATRFLAEFTHGRFELRMLMRDGGAAFEAMDTRDGTAKQLGQLSAGERIQLLLAVRLAFLEQEEHGVRLPLVLDEILGTTDDERAGAIIDAVIEICRSGRQVFYLTAQPDEVGKWRGRLAEATDLSVGVVDLAGVRGHAARQASPLEIQRPTLPSVPAPEDMDHATYGERIGVPGLQPVTGSGAVHPWHVVDDPLVVHRLLVGRVTALGPLLALARAGAAEGVGGFDAAALERLPARARAIDAAFDAWRIGRGVPVDRAVLAASGAVSDNFIDDVSELAAARDGDAEAILQSLEDGGVAGFRKAKIVQLRLHLEDQGHLVHEVRLDAEAITHRVLAAAAGDLEAGRIEIDWITTMVGRLPDVPVEASGSASAVGG